MQNNNVNKGIFHFLGTTIWAPMQVYQYENPSGYITDTTTTDNNELFCFFYLWLHPFHLHLNLKAAFFEGGIFIVSIIVTIIVWL